jgi:hypothetical protein
MLLRCCAFLCIASGLASADATTDYFSDAFGKALPSPFRWKLPGKGPGRSLLESPPKRALVLDSRECAIPLKEAPVAKDRRFSMRQLFLPPDAKLDAMARPAMPTCQR